MPETATIGRRDFFSRQQQTDGLLKGKVLSDVAAEMPEVASYCSDCAWEDGAEKKLDDYFNANTQVGLGEGTTKKLPTLLEQTILNHTHWVPDTTAYHVQLVVRPATKVQCALKGYFKPDAFENPESQYQQDKARGIGVKRWYNEVDFCLLVTAFKDSRSRGVLFDRHFELKKAREITAKNSYLSTLQAWESSTNPTTWKKEYGHWFSHAAKLELPLEFVRSLDKKLRSFLWPSVPEQLWAQFADGMGFESGNLIVSEGGLGPIGPQNAITVPFLVWKLAHIDSHKIGVVDVKYKCTLRTEVRVCPV